MDYGNIVGSLITAGATLFGLWAEKQWKDRKKPDLSDKDYEDLLNPIIQQIKEEFNPYRLSYFSFHNGEKTFDGYSLKNLSMMVESNADGVDDIILELQKVPVIAFKRQMSQLRDAPKDEPIIVTYEGGINDKLAELYRSFGMNTVIVAKTQNYKKKNPWSGFIVLGFQEQHKVISAEKLSWLRVQVLRINEIISEL
jgi:hypothetical protein